MEARKSKIYYAWNSYLHHTFSCKFKEHWLEIFLLLVIKRWSEHQEPRLPRIISMCNSLCEQLFRDVRGLGENVIRDYFTKGRGWKLLATLLASDIKVLSCPQQLVDILIAVYNDGLQSEENLASSQSFLLWWPLSGIEDCWIDKNPVAKEEDYEESCSAETNFSRKFKDESRGFSSVSCHPVSCDDEQNCRDAVEENLNEEKRVLENEDPLLMQKCESMEIDVQHFQELILAVLEKVVDFHGLTTCSASSDTLAERVFSFSLEMLNSPSSEILKRRLLRVILVCVAVRWRNCTTQERNLALDCALPQKMLSMARGCLKDVQFHTEVVHGILIFLLRLIQQSNAVEMFETIRRFLHQFCDPSNISLLKKSGEAESEIIRLYGLVSSQFIQLILRKNHRSVCSKRRHKLCNFGKFHHSDCAGSPLSDPAQLEEQPCIPGFLFYLLIEIFMMSDNENLQKESLEALNAAGPCCCLPAEYLYSGIFSHLVGWESQIRCLSAIFLRLGFASSRFEQCAYCRKNAGFDLERYAEAGEYSVDEALLVTSQLRQRSQSHPWESFNLYCDAILNCAGDPVSISLARNVASLIPSAALYVRRELFIRVVQPLISAFILHIKKSPQDRGSNTAVVFRTLWSVLSSLIRNRGICELFVLTNGIDYVLELCHLPCWAADGAAVLRRLAANELHNRQEQKGQWHLVELQEIVPKENSAPEKVVEATALDLFEYLLSIHVISVLRIVNCSEEARILRDLAVAVDSHSARSPISKLISSQNDDPDDEGSTLRKAAALWEAATQLAVSNSLFLNFLGDVSLIPAAEGCLYGVTQKILQLEKNPKFYFELFESFLTLTLISRRAENGKFLEESGLKLLELMLERNKYHPALRTLFQIVMRCTTLEKWLIHGKSHKFSAESGEFSPEVHRKSYADEDSGYFADAEPCPMFVDPLKSEWPRLSQGILYFPQLCNKLLRSLTVWFDGCKNSGEDLDLFLKDAYLVVTRFYRISCLPLNAAVLNGFGAIPAILQDLKPLILSTQSEPRIRNLLLKTVSSLAEQHITNKDFRLLIDLFKTENPPMNELLPACSDLIRGIALQPTSILEFPQKRVSGKSDLTSKMKIEASQDIFTFSSSGKDFGQAHYEKGLGSAWKSAAIFIPVLADSDWSLRTHGFSVSFWFYVVPPDHPARSRDAVRTLNPEQNDSTWLEASLEFDQLEEKPEKPEPGPDSALEPNPELHILSAGTKQSLLELWSDPQTESIIIRITESNKSHSRCLATQSLDLKIRNGQWHHMFVSCFDKGPARNGSFRIEAVLDGCSTTSLTLDVPFSSIRQQGHAHLLLGNAVGSTEPCQMFWYLGNAALFRGEVVSVERAIHLFCLGPDYVGLATTLESKPLANYRKMLKPDMMKNPVNWRNLFADVELKCLQENLLLVYSAHSPDVVYLYPVVTRPAAGLLGSLLSGGHGAFSVVSSDPRPSQHAPMRVPVARTTNPKAQVHNGLPAAVRHSGGYSVFLYLMARITELDASEEQQAHAFEILLDYLRTDPHQMQVFRASQGLTMVRHLFRSDKCKVGKHFVRVLVNACCSSAVVRYRCSPVACFRVSLNTPAIISDPYLLVQGLRMWNIWQIRKDSSVLQLLLEAFRTLLRDNHPHRSFNIMQLRRFQFADALLQIAKENLLYREGYPLTESHLLLISDLLNDMLSSPPDLEIITSIIDYLLLTHPAACTYVISVWDNFFFLFAQPEASRNVVFSGRSWAMPRVFRTETASSSVVYEHPVDPQTFNKALTNIEVKWDTSGPKQNGSDMEEGSKSSENIPEKMNSPEVKPEGIEIVPAGSNPEMRKSKKREIVEIGEWQVISHSANQCNVSRAECALGSRLREKLLDLLTNCLRFVPDYMIEQLIGRIINPECLLVMLNYPDEGVRAATIRLLNAAFLRSESEALKFVKQHGVLLLASQIQHQPITFAIVEACLGICLGLETNFESMVDPLTLWPQDLSPLQLQGILLLVAALPDSAVDPPLLHNLVTLFRTLVASSNTMLRWTLDCGLLEAIGKTLVILGHMSPSRTDIFGQRGDELLVEGLQRLILATVTRCVGMSGQCQWNVFQDFLTLLLFLERIEEESCGPGGHSIYLLRETCCIVIRQAMENIESIMRNRSGSGANPIDDTQHGKDHFGNISDKLIAGYLPLGSTRKLSFDKTATKNELCERFKYLVTKGTDIVISLAPAQSQLTEVEINFTKGFFLAVLQSFAATLERCRSPIQHITGDWNQFSAPESDDSWINLLWTCRDVLKIQLGRLILHLLNPTQSSSLQAFVVKAIQQDPLHERLLRMLIANSDTYRQELDSYLYRILLFTSPEEVDQGTFLRIQCLLKLLSPKINGTSKKYYRLPEIPDFIQQLQNERTNWLKSMEDPQLKLIQKHENIFKLALDSGMRMTRETVETQNSLRKKFMETLRSSYGDLTSVTKSWKDLISNLCHEKAPWFSEESWIKSWKLSTVEGPQRMRIRLDRSNLNIDPKYFLPHARFSKKVERPLSFLMKRSVSDKIQHLVLRGKVRFSANCNLVTVTEDIRGEVIVSENDIYFIADPSNKKKTHLTWNFAKICEIWKRRYEHQDRAIELFVSEREVFFFALDSTAERNLFYNKLNIILPKLIPHDEIADVTQLWREGHMTNFEYLTYLNKAAGRSLNDLMQYPVFPFVLAIYSSKDLNLDDPKIYRNFRKPIAVQHPEREPHYIETYNYLKRSAESGGEVSKCGPYIAPFHYGSLYSNPGIVLHYLVRLPPFTQMFLAYQDRNFDIPDRTFHSLETAWRLSSSESTTDVKELIPEFFYNSRFLVNNCGFNFGIRQSGEPVNDVILPPWSQNDPRLFILIHRQALESRWVRDHLHHWIDLIFGYKQSGIAAVESINVFHPATSPTFEANCEDPIECSARRTMIRTYGQLPRILFRNPHPMSSQQYLAGSGTRNRTLIPQVENVSWGAYVGSPSQQDPVTTWIDSYPLAVNSFLILKTGDSYALGPYTSAIVSYSYENSILSKPSGILGIALVLWGHPDGSVRIKFPKDQPTKPVTQLDQTDPVVLCETVPDGNTLWIALASGSILVYSFLFDPVKSIFELTCPPKTLIGHQERLSSLKLNSEFGIVVSGGNDGSCIIWDFYKLKYIRSFSCEISKGCPVRSLAIGSTLGDIATVYEKNPEGSILELRTVNGDYVASVETEHPITSVCISSAPEGISVNVVAAGFKNGIIRLWNTWNLDHVRDIMTETLTSSLISLAYSNDSQQLFGSTPNGKVYVWELPNSKRVHRQPPFLNLSLH